MKSFDEFQQIDEETDMSEIAYFAMGLPRPSGCVKTASGMEGNYWSSTEDSIMKSNNKALIQKWKKLEKVLIQADKELEQFKKYVGAI